MDDKAKNEFVERVMARLPTLTDNTDIELFKADIARRYVDGWTENECVRYCMCMEEVDPNLDEDIALTRMAWIRGEVKARGGRV